MIVINGQVVAQGAQFSLEDVEVITATVDLEEVRTYRFAPSRGMQAVLAPKYDRIKTSFSLSKESDVLDFDVAPTPPREIQYHSPEEEIALGPGCYLWDYLRRSRQAGYLVPLSGGIDSCATAVIVFSMCRIVMKAVENKNEQVIADVRRIAGAYGQPEDWLPKSPEELCNNLFHTVYMGMKTQSSKETRSRAKDLAKAIGAYHQNVDIDDVFHAQKSILSQATGFEPKFKVHGGSLSENLALQNIQARSRMVTAYNFAQLLPTIRGRQAGGGLLVLGSANVDEALRGYLTKYDCSSADINPIGSISKTDLKRFIAYARDEFDLPILEDFITAVPTAELEPITNDYVQADEVDMGMTYDELSQFGILRKINKLGPYSMFLNLLNQWKDKMSPADIAKKVKVCISRLILSPLYKLWLSPFDWMVNKGNGHHNSQVKAV
jgi:NAD+ synthase (glutamine-hydrolysing)